MPSNESGIKAAIRSAGQRFTKANPRSRARFERACVTFPGGHTRQSLLFTPFPLTMIAGSGAKLTDLDGHRYLDLVGDYAAGVYGHSEPTIQRAAHAAIDQGMSLGAINDQELELGELIVRRIPSIEHIRFCNSGSEACLYSAILARHATGRSQLLAFDGGYHGSFMTYGESSSPLNVPFEVITATYNDIDGTRTTIRAAAEKLAAVLVEPMMGAGGSIPATPQFLEMLRQETTSCGALLVFDEVMTSRLAPGGLQGRYGIRPDITALGKFWGGGFNFGAFGGSRNVMRHLDTLSGGQLAQAGTFNNNRITMAVGAAGARDVYDSAACEQLNARGDELRKRLNQLRRKHGVAFQVTGIGGVMTLHWHDRPISCPADAEPAHSPARTLFQLEMLLAGFYVAHRGYTTLSLALTEPDLAEFVNAVDSFLERFRPVLDLTNEAAR
jgi:glutamate-1-semialdehyde 2,1-aminomutase